MKTIPIADAHDHLRLLVSKTLGGPDYRIVEARDGDEAYALALTENPELGARGQHDHGDVAGAQFLAQRLDHLDALSPIELMETVEKLLGERGCR